jgi:hypothetical protein
MLRLLIAVFLALFGLGFVAPAWAGGALKTNINGVPYRWGETLVYNVEGGALKSGVYDAAASRALIEEAFEKWAGVSGVNLEILGGDPLPDGGDTTINNFEQFYNAGASDCYDGNPSTPCYSPIIFDEDGSIIEKLFGECSQFSMVGFAGFVNQSNPSGDPLLNELKKGQAIFSGACIAPAVTKDGCSPCKQILDDEAIRSLILHELGHFLGMDHSQVNPESYLACSGGSCPDEVQEDLPTMFPMLMKSASMATLHRDDIAQFQRLYGSPQEDTCSVTGNVLASDGTTPLRGVEIVARNTDPALSTTDAISFISGAEAPRLTAKDKTQENCLEDCGKYEISGLTRGETYQLCTQRVLNNFTGTRALNPVEVPFQGVDNDCPEGLTVTCECPAGGPCPSYQGKDIVTSNLGVDFSIVSPDGQGVAGGCSLVKDPPRWIWKKLSAAYQAVAAPSAAMRFIQ